MSRNLKCHEMVNVTKFQMSRNVKCHEMSNVTKCQMSRNFKCFLYICICVAATVLWLHVRAALYLRLPHLMSSGHSAQPINHQTRSMTAVTHLSKQLCRRMQVFFNLFFSNMEYIFHLFFVLCLNMCMFQRQTREL